MNIKKIFTEMFYCTAVIFSFLIVVKVQCSGNDGVTVQEKKNRLECSTCRATFAFHSGLSRHKKLHWFKEQGITFRCNTCNKAFSCPDYLKNHMAVHKNTRNFICGVDGCKKSYKQPSSLSRHRNSKHERKGVKRSKRKRSRASLENTRSKTAKKAKKNEDAQVICAFFASFLDSKKSPSYEEWDALDKAIFSHVVRAVRAVKLSKSGTQIEIDEKDLLQIP